MQGVYNQPIGYPSYYLDSNGNIKYSTILGNQNSTFNKVSKPPPVEPPVMNPHQPLHYPRQPSDFCTAQQMDYNSNNNQTCNQYPQNQLYSQIDKENTNSQMRYNNIPTSYQQYSQLDKDQTNNRMGYNSSPYQYPQNQQYAEIKKDNTDIKQPQNVYNLSSTKDQYPQQLPNQNNYFNNSNPYSQPNNQQYIGSAYYNYSYKPEFNQQNESDKMEEPGQNYGSKDYSNNLQNPQQNQPNYGNQYQSKYNGEKQINQQPNAINGNVNANENIPRTISDNSNFISNEIEISNIEYPTDCNNSEDNLESTNIQPCSIERKKRSLNETLEAANVQNCSLDGKRFCLEESFKNMSLCKTCAEIIQKHFNKDIDEVKELVPDSSIQKIDKPNINEEPSELPPASTSKVSIVDQPENVISSSNVEPDKEGVKPVGDNDSAIYEGHPTRRDRPSVQNCVEDVCTRCGGWTLVKEDPQNAVHSSNLPKA